MKKISSILLGVTLLTSAAAQAAAVQASCPMPAPASATKASEAPKAAEAATFAGLYVGLGLGYSFGKIKETQLSPKGFALGVFAGYGLELSKIYLGLEGGYYMDTASNKKIVGTTVMPQWTQGDQVEAKKKDRLELAARVGYNLGRMLPYVKVGWASSKVEVTNKTTGNKFYSKDLSGTLLGGGLDFKVSPKATAGVEYTYVNLKKSNLKMKDQKIGLRFAYNF